MRRFFNKYDILCLGLIASVFALFAYNSWMRWPDVLIDFGRELYTPWRLAQGDVLYKDIITFNGPFSYCIMALSFSLFGESLVTMAVVNMLISLIFLLSAYIFFLRIGGPLMATACCLIYLVFFAFGHFTTVGNYNWIFPYSMSYVYGTTLTMVVLTVFQEAMLNPRSQLIALAGALYGLILLTRVEVILASTVAIGCCFASLIIIHRPSLKKSLSWIGVFIVTTFGASIFFLIAFHGIVRPQAVFGQLIGPLLFGAQGGMRENIFYEHVTGFSNIWDNLKASGLSTLKVTLITGIAFCLNRIYTEKGKFNSKMLPVIAALIFVVLMIFKKAPPFLFHSGAFTFTTIIIGITAFAMFVMNCRKKKAAVPYASMFVFAAFSGVLLLKILLRPGFAHYGFVLGVGGGLLLVSGLILFRNVASYQTRSAVLYTIIISLCLATDTFWGYTLSSKVYAFKTFPVESVRGEKMFCFPRHVGITKSGPLIKRLVREIEQRMQKGDSFTVLPEGVTLNYLTRRKTPIGYLSFMPTELARRGDREVIRSLERKMPDYILLVPKHSAEFGVGLFGVDPRNGLEIMRWVNKHYVAVWREDDDYDSLPQMRSIIYERKSGKKVLKP